jgi:hypothetical protein
VAAPDHTTSEPDEIRAEAKGTAPVPLSVLDLVTVGAGRTATDALRTSVKLSRLAEAAASTATGSPSTTPCRAWPPPPPP